jgi:hypothetical protein
MAPQFGVADNRSVSPYLPAFDGNEEDTKSPEATMYPGSGLKMSRKETSQLKADKQIAWLESELAKRPGYVEFKASRNRPKNYAAVVQTWEFAARFDQEYSDTMRGVSPQMFNLYTSAENIFSGIPNGKDYERSSSRGSRDSVYLDV